MKKLAYSITARHLIASIIINHHPSGSIFVHFATPNKFNIFLVITITTCDIFQSFLTAVKDSPSLNNSSFTI